MIIIFAGLFLVLAGAWAVTMCVIPAIKVSAYKSLLITHGEKLEIAELVPPPVATGQNGADIANRASRLLNPGDDLTNFPPAMKMIAPGKAIICFEQPVVRDDIYHYTNSWTNVMAAVETNRPGTDLLKQEMNYPSLDFSLNYTTDDITEGTRVHQALKNCAERLSAEAICALRGRDTAPAATNICIILALVNGEHDERFVVTPIERIWMASVAASATWELLQATNVTDGELVLLQQNWEKLEFLQALENAVLMNRAQTENTIKKMRASGRYFDSRIAGDATSWDFSGDLRDDLGTIWEHMEWGYAKSMWYGSWSYSDELRALQNDQMTLEAVRSVETNGYFYPANSNLRARFLAIEKSQGSSELNIIRWRFSEGSEFMGMDFFDRIMAADAGKKITVTAIALKRYQLKHANYPSNLNSLVPEFLSAIPLDPVDKKPLRYRLNANGPFLLYSIGTNGKDDGGNASDPRSHDINYWLNPHALDWVWPKPATPEEVENFYAHPPS